MPKIYEKPIFNLNPDLVTELPVVVAPLFDSGNKNIRTDSPEYGEIMSATNLWSTKISWVSITGAVSYNLYVSISPFRNGNLVQNGITSNSTTFNLPVFPENIKFYYWVAAVDAQGDIAYILKDPVSVQTRLEVTAFAPNQITPDLRNVPNTSQLNKEMRKAVSYIRANHRLQLQLGAENGILFKIRRAADAPYGVPCACTTSALASSDPDYQGRGRCTFCFGTGIFGGYYPGVPLLFRYESAPADVYKRTSQGFQIEHKFNSWTLWEPKIDQDDIIVRVGTGQRFRVNETHQSSIHGITLHQEFDLKEVEHDSILYQVTNENIDKAVQKANIPGYRKNGFISFG